MQNIVVVCTGSQVTALIAALMCGRCPEIHTVTSSEQQPESIITEVLFLESSLPDPCSFDFDSILCISNGESRNKPDWGKYPKQKPRARVIRRGLHGVW